MSRLMAGIMRIKGSVEWLGTRRAQMRLALRVTIAGSLALVLAKVLGLPQGYWAAITAVVVVQASVGASIKAARDRFIGTLAGAIYGGAIAAIASGASTTGLGLAVVVALFPLAFLAALDSSFRVAPVTALIMLLPSVGQEVEPLVTAFNRVAEITLGDIVGLSVALLVLPARAHSLMSEAAAKVVDLNAELLVVFLNGLIGDAEGRSRAKAIHPRIRAELKKAEAAADEATRERKSYLSDAADPEPLVRTLYRVRHDLVMIGRAALTPLPAPALERLGASLGRFREAVEQLLHELAQALRTRGAAPGPERFEANLQSLLNDIESLRSDPVTDHPMTDDPMVDPLSGDAIGRIFALRFALQQLRQNLDDLLARTDELVVRGKGVADRP